MLKLRTIGIRDYSVLEGGQRIGRIRFTEERMPGVWLWNINVHLKGFQQRSGMAGDGRGQDRLPDSDQRLPYGTVRPSPARGGFQSAGGLVA